MMEKLVVLVVCCILFSLSQTLAAHVSSSPSVVSSSRTVLVWFCLEICPSNVTRGANTSLANSLQQVENHPFITEIAYEHYTLSPQGEFIDFSSVYGLTNLFPLLPKNRAKTPMISSYPHPPAFIDYMRLLFANPQPFIDAAVSDGVLYSYSGYNIDFEPTENATAADGLAYANFLNIFATALNEANMKLTVDFASWTPIWNLSAINLTAISSAISMDTYAKDTQAFLNGLKNLQQIQPIARQMVGFDVMDYQLTPALFQWRLDQVAASGISQLAFWDMPIPDDYWPILEQWVKQGEKEQTAQE